MFWSLKPRTERQRDQVERSVCESVDLAIFFPGEVTARLGKGYRRQMPLHRNMIHVSSSISSQTQKRFPFHFRALFPCPGTPLRRFHFSFAPAHFSSPFASSVHARPSSSLSLGPTPLVCFFPKKKLATKFTHKSGPLARRW